MTRQRVRRVVVRIAASVVLGALAPGASLAADTDGDGLGDTVDNCFDVANPGQENLDEDMLGDACDPCTNTDGRYLNIKPQLKLQRAFHDPAIGDESVSLSGAFISAVPFSSLDAESNGLRIVLQKYQGRPFADIVVPGGAGWTNDGGTISYSDGTGAHNGITSIQLKDDSGKAPNRVALKIKGKGGNYPVSVSEIPLNATIIVGAAGNGNCTETAFLGGDCVIAGSSTGKCKPMKKGKRVALRLRATRSDVSPFRFRDAGDPGAVDAFSIGRLFAASYWYRPGETLQMNDSTQCPVGAFSNPNHDWSKWPIVTQEEIGVIVRNGEKLDLNGLNGRFVERMQPDSSFTQNVGYYQIDAVMVDPYYVSIIHDGLAYDPLGSDILPRYPEFAGATIHQTTQLVPGYAAQYPWFNDLVAGTAFENSGITTQTPKILFVRNDWFPEPVSLVAHCSAGPTIACQPMEYTIVDSTIPLTSTQHDLVRSLFNRCDQDLNPAGPYVIVPFQGVNGPVIVNFSSAKAPAEPNGVNVFSVDNFVADINVDLDEMLDTPYPSGGEWDGVSAWNLSDGTTIPLYTPYQAPIYKHDVNYVPWGLTLTFHEKEQ